MIDYKIFFSYQSDITENKDFIKEALKNVNKKLEDQGVHLIIDEGMRDVAGNPVLLDVMLNKGSICDIFIADLTYVTKFFNSAGFEKYVPNPNVMLELGHAWNFHKNEHTIFIQNNAYGESKDLPVDLKGFRFPINFTLKKDELEEKKTKIRKELSSDLYKAISSSIGFINESKKTEFLPFERFTFSKLNSLDRYKFVKTDYFNYINDEIKKILFTKNDIVISGERCSGKSRIVRESILNSCSEQKTNDIYYCDLSSSTGIEISNKLKELKHKLLRPTTFIIDNCTDTERRMINDSILNSSDTNCIYIISGKHKGDINIDKKTHINQLLSQNSKGNDILTKCGYDLNLIFAELYNEESSITISQINIQYGVSYEQERFVKHLSLFSKVGFDDSLRDEFNLFCKVFNFDRDISSHTVNDLLMKNLLVRKGGFVYFEADRIAEQYSCELWEQDVLRDFSISKLSESSNLINSFINRQVEVHKKSTVATQFLLSYIKTDLRNTAILDTSYGNHIVYKLSEYFSTDILLSIEIANRNFPDYIYSQFSGIYWALNRMYSKKSTFRRAGNLLLKLSKYNTEKQYIVNLIKEHFFIIDNAEYNTRLDLLEDFYKKGEFDLVFDIYLESFKIEPIITTANINDKRLIYLTKIIDLLITKREDHKERIDPLIVDIIPIACNLGLSKHIFSAVRLMIKESEVNKDIYIKLIQTKDILSGSKFKNDRKKINRILTQISNNNVRNLLYGKIMLSRLEWDKSYEERIQLMDNFALELTLREGTDWVEQIDVLLSTGRTFDGNAIILGKVLTNHYSSCEALIDRCLEIYKTIPVEEQSYGLIIGLLQSKIENNDYSEFKEFRDALLEDSLLVHCGIAISNYLPTNIEDLHKIKNAIIKYDLPFKLINLSTIDLSNNAIEIIVSELIEYNKDAADTGLIMLDNALQFDKVQKKDNRFNPTTILLKVLNLYNFWNPENYHSNSTYGSFIDLLEETLRLYPDDTFAEKIIISIINNCGGINFNTNYSVNDLFKLLIANYQSLFLSKIVPLLDKKDILDSLKLRKLEDMLDYSNDADAQQYLTWCKQHGKEAAEFVAYFITLIEYDEKGNQKWTVEALYLMTEFSEDPYVLSIISTRLYNGSVNIWRYQNIKNAYDLLLEHINDTVRLWAVQEAEKMEQAIEREKQSIERHNIWDK